MNYKDPLFSVIIFFLIILIAIVLALVLGKIKEILKQKEIEKLMQNFEYFNEDLNNPLNALLLLAKAYEKEGNYEKAIEIFLLVQKDYPSNKNLLNIAKCYFKAGFLQKAEHIVEKILKTNPRNKEALKLLILIDEKFNNLKEIIDIIEIFDELEVSLPKEKANAMIKLFLQNGCNIEEFCEGVKDFEDIYKKYPFVKREYLSYLFGVNIKKAYEMVDVYEYLDLFWYRNDIPDNKKFCNILAAKKLTNCKKKAPFEIEVLKNLNNNIAELEFEYVCENCKKTFPLYSTRCPKCGELFTQKLLIKFMEKKEVENIEF